MARSEKPDPDRDLRRDLRNALHISWFNRGQLSPHDRGSKQDFLTHAQKLLTETIANMRHEDAWKDEEPAA